MGASPAPGLRDCAAVRGLCKPCLPPRPEAPKTMRAKKHRATAAVAIRWRHVAPAERMGARAKARCARRLSGGFRSARAVVRQGPGAGCRRLRVLPDRPDPGFHPG